MASKEYGNPNATATEEPPIRIEQPKDISAYGFKSVKPALKDTVVIPMHVDENHDVVRLKHKDTIQGGTTGTILKNFTDDQNLPLVFHVAGEPTRPIVKIRNFFFRIDHRGEIGSKTFERHQVLHETGNAESLTYGIDVFAKFFDKNNAELQLANGYPDEEGYRVARVRFHSFHHQKHGVQQFEYPDPLIGELTHHTFYESVDLLIDHAESVDLRIPQRNYNYWYYQPESI